MISNIQFESIVKPIIGIFLSSFLRSFFPSFYLPFFLFSSSFFRANGGGGRRHPWRSAYAETTPFPQKTLEGPGEFGNAWGVRRPTLFRCPPTVPRCGGGSVLTSDLYRYFLPFRTYLLHRCAGAGGGGIFTTERPTFTYLLGRRCIITRLMYASH